MWTKARGIETLDDLSARFAEIRFRDGGVSLRRGEPDSPENATLDWAGSLEDFTRNWAGEEFWFIARRVLRRLKHETALDHKLKPGSGEGGPVIILVEAQMADNIGMAARAMANFGIEDMRLVAPRHGWPNDKARFAASGAHPVIDAATAYPDIKAAMADLTWVCATTARPRHLAKPVMTPDEAIAEMITRMGRGERCGILFGPERTGLTTDAVANADALVMVRVSPTFASLNLAQAVLLMGYEWLKQTGGGAIGRHTEHEGVDASGLHTGSPAASQSGAPRLLRAHRGGTGAQWAFQTARKTTNHGAQSAGDVRAHGRDAARSPHLARNRRLTDAFAPQGWGRLRRVPQLCLD